MVTNSPRISHLLTEHDVELIYTLASRIMVGDIEVHEDVEGRGYLEFLTTLEAVIKVQHTLPIIYHYSTITNNIPLPIIYHYCILNVICIPSALQVKWCSY